METKIVIGLGGVYYLAEDITFNEGNVPVVFTGQLCLNGHVLNLNDNYITIQNCLVITDCNSTTEHKFSISDYNWVLDENGDQTVNGGVITGGSNRVTNQFNYNDPCMGGAIYVGSLSGQPANLYMYGGAIVGNMATGNGGGIYIPGGSTAYIRGDAKILGNYVYSGGGIYSSGNSTLNVFENAQISYNTANGYGGGIRINQNSNATISGNVEISHNDAFNGGGVGMISETNLDNAILTIDGARIINNTANDDAGIHFYNNYTKEVVLKDTVIENNVAKNAGGGMNTPNTYSPDNGYVAGGDYPYYYPNSGTYFFIIGDTKIQNNYVEKEGTKTPSNMRITADKPLLERMYRSYFKTEDGVNSVHEDYSQPLSPNARIGVSGDVGTDVAISEHENDIDYSRCFFSDLGHDVVYTAEKIVKIAEVVTTALSIDGDEITTKNATEAKAVLVVASYDENDTLIDVKLIDVAPKTIAETGVNVTNAKTVKVMLWENMQTIKPLVSIAEKTIENQAN